MKHNQTKIHKACEYLAESHNAEFAPEYGEPGYANPEFGVRFTYANGASGTLCACSTRYGTRDKWCQSHAQKLAREFRGSGRVDIRASSVRVVRFGAIA